MKNLSPSDIQILDKLNRIIPEKMPDPQFRISKLAREMGMSCSNLHQRVQGITGKTVTALVSAARIGQRGTGSHGTGSLCNIQAESFRYQNQLIGQTDMGLSDFNPFSQIICFLYQKKP